MVNQRWHIEDNAKAKTREKIQEINEQAEQEIAKIIPAKQLEAFKACQAQRDQEKAKRQGATVQKQQGP